MITNVKKEQTAVICHNFYRAMLCIARTMLSQDFCLSVCLDTTALRIYSARVYSVVLAMDKLRV